MGRKDQKKKAAITVLGSFLWAFCTFEALPFLLVLLLVPNFATPQATDPPKTEKGKGKEKKSSEEGKNSAPLPYWGE